MEPNVRILPSLPLSPLDDTGPARRHWAAITISVAWELASALPRVRPATLQAARDHVAWMVPDSAGLAEVEALAVAATQDFLRRKAGRYARMELDADLDILPDPRWREAVLATATPVHEAVFRLHYGDGVALEELAPRLKLDIAWLRPAREAVRELVKEIVSEDGVPTEGWDTARLDRLVARVALAAGDRCPGPGGLGTEVGRAHGESCPRCGRALRLIREGVISPADLFAPEQPVPPPSESFTLLHVHPEARRYLKRIARACPGAVRVAEDQFVFLGELGDSLPALTELALAGTPSRDKLRLVRMAVGGRFADGVLVGKAPLALQEAAQLMPWGEARGCDPLPPPAPPAPSAARWWATAALLCGLALAAAVGAMTALEPGPAFELSAAREGTHVVFDTDDAAYIDVLAISPSHAELLFHSTDVASKGALAAGDGRYRVPVDGRPVLVVSSPVRLDDSELIAASARDADDARQRLRARYPTASVRILE